MNLKNRIILEDYRKQRDAFVKLGDVVAQYAYGHCGRNGHYGAWH